jgi:hypothetical protein
MCGGYSSLTMAFKPWTLVLSCINEVEPPVYTTRQMTILMSSIIIIIIIIIIITTDYN